MKTIKSERIRHGLTQQKVAEITGVPLRTIQNWEGGQRKCPEYVERMVLDKLNRMFDEPDYKSILEETLDMLKSDLQHLKNADTKRYVENVISDVEDSLK